MGFYGNIADTSHIYFQFDKMFSNRYEMDTAAAAGTDGIFQGRFVLVKYDPDGNFFEQDMLYGYLQDDGSITADIYGEKPYKYTEFTPVPIESLSSENWSSYYRKSGNYYFPLPSVDYFDDTVQYYTADANEDADPPELNLVYEGQIVRLRDSSGNPTQLYYICADDEENELINEVGEVAIFQEVTSSMDLPTYLVNYNIDKARYGTGFDWRSYDATVWQKVYSEGNGRFILIAYLNALVPQIELYPSPPSMEPSTPYIDGKSSDALYRIHVPTHWGLWIKEAEPEGEEPNVTYPKSDQTTTRYDSELEEDVEVPADIYLNLGGEDKATYHKTNSNKDTETANEVTITPTGKSGKIYYDEQGNEVEEDMLELSIHLPLVGNMIDDGYDLIYGVNDDEEHTRPRDINWYNGNESENLKLDGNAAIGGKTYDLNTLAGVLNTWHERLGQIIVPYETRPLSMEGLSPDNIYYIADEEKYFRIGTGYQYTELSVDHVGDYSFSEADVDLENYVPNTYYIWDSEENKYVPATSDTFDSTETYYEKNIAAEVYHIIDPPLTRYDSGDFFMKRGSDYIRDNAVQPTAPTQTYYTIDEDINESTNESDDLIRIPGSSFSDQYRANTFYYKDEDDNYMVDTSAIPTQDVYYLLTITSNNRYVNVILYAPNKFYYLDDNGQYKPAAYENTTAARDVLGNAGILYWLEFDETEDIVTVYYDDQGVLQTIIGHPLKEAHPIPLASMIDIPDNTDNFYYVYNNVNYIAYKNIDTYIDDTDDTPAFARPGYYVVVTNIEVQTNLYVTGKYYYLDDEAGVGSYIISYNDLDRNIYYYYIKQTHPVPTPFYLPNTYYWQSSYNYFELDNGPRMTTGRDYYTKVKLYVLVDEEGRCPYGYEWNDLALFVPASVTLGYRTETQTFIEIKNFLDGTGSINGHLLQLEDQLSLGNEDVRDKNTFRGCLNLFQDYLYPFGKFIPQRMIYVNNFGQITSSQINYAKLKSLVDRADDILASLE